MLTFEVFQEMWEATRDVIEREAGWALAEASGPDPSLLATAILEEALRASKSQGLLWLREGQLL